MSSELIKREDLEDPPGGWLEYYANGKVQAKNAEGKMIKHPKNKMPKSAAAEMGSMPRGPDLDTTEALLDELGLSGPFHEQLAQVLIKGGTGAVGAAKELVKSSKERGVFKADAENQAQNNCPYVSHCVLFKAYGDTWEPGEKEREIAAAKARLRERPPASKQEQLPTRIQANRDVARDG